MWNDISGIKSKLEEWYLTLDVPASISLKRDVRGRHFISNLTKRLFLLATPAVGTAIRVSDYTATREDAKNKSNGHYTSIFRRRTHDHYYYYYLREA